MTIDKETDRKVQTILGSLFTLGQNRWGWTPPHFFSQQIFLFQ